MRRTRTTSPHSKKYTAAAASIRGTIKEVLKYSYAVLGLGFLIILGSLWYLSDPMLVLSSPTFQNGGSIPQKYTCDGERELSPPLSVSGVPKEAKMLVLIVDDPDVPKQLRPDGVFDHWVVYGIHPATTDIAEGAVFGAQGVNSTGKPGYVGPCPPKEYEPSEHRYIFRIYAVDLPTLTFVKAPTKAEVFTAIKGHILETAELMGKYKRI